jgi:outer membrane protein assembly factor BamB
MCGCELSLYGHIALGPVPSDATRLSSTEPARWATSDNLTNVARLGIGPRDWTAYRGANDRADRTSVEVPAQVKLAWQANVVEGDLPTAPVTAGDLVFIADRRGILRALDSKGNQVWKAHTAGPVYYPPAIALDRLFVGCGDGRVYAFEARTGRQLWAYRVAPAERRIPVLWRWTPSRVN